MRLRWLPLTGKAGLSPSGGTGPPGTPLPRRDSCPQLCTSRPRSPLFRWRSDTRVATHSERLPRERPEPAPRRREAQCSSEHRCLQAEAGGGAAGPSAQAERRGSPLRLAAGGDPGCRRPAVGRSIGRTAVSGYRSPTEVRTVGPMRLVADTAEHGHRHSGTTTLGDKGERMTRKWIAR